MSPPDFDLQRDGKQPARRFVPIIDRNRCEGRADCVQVCPYQVFEMGTVAEDERRGLSLIGRIKGFRYRWRQAMAARADTCHACGLCVAACPEKAITLRRVASAC